MPVPFISARKFSSAAATVYLDRVAFL
jgi:hypothetical protein